jgi:hypothetical protein
MSDLQSVNIKSAPFFSREFRVKVARAAGTSAPMDTRVNYSIADHNLPLEIEMCP